MDDKGETSDGYHTFNELYDHRITLWIAYCKLVAECLKLAHMTFQQGCVWRSRFHGDGKPAFDGKWFVLGLNHSAGKQITYHIPIDRWDETKFAETLINPPKFDGHTSNDVIDRLKAL